MNDAPPKNEVTGEKVAKKDERARWTIYDVFFWRDAPDWYRKTFLSAGFGLCYCTLKQYLNRHQLEVFMPPRSKILPQTMQEGYRNSQMLKYGFLKVGSEVTTIAGAAATYYAGAYYLGRYRGNVHTWENFAVSGSVAGLGVALWLLRPFKARPAAFGMMLGGMLGGAGPAVQQSFGEPFWDESHDFEGWFLGGVINLKESADATSSLSISLAEESASVGVPSVDINAPSVPLSIRSQTSSTEAGSDVKSGATHTLPVSPINHSNPTLKVAASEMPPVDAQQQAAEAAKSSAKWWRVWR